MMTHRERVMAAINHREPDRVPVDIGGTFATTLNVYAYEALKEYLGIRGRPTEIDSPRSATARIDEDILVHLDVDCRGIRGGGPESHADQELPDGSYIDAWGVTWAKPTKGHYYVKKPIFIEDLTPAALCTYHWPDPTDPGYTRGLRESALALHNGTDYCIVFCLPVGFIHQSQWLRGYDAWLMDLVTDPNGLTRLMDAVLDVYLEIARRQLREVAGQVDLVFYGDDIAFQQGPIMKMSIFRTLIKPRLKRVFDLIKTETGCPIIYHTCGSVVTLIPDLIEIGVDCLNPVQVSAVGMDTANLKAEFGRDLAFWGAIDTQRVLPFGTPDEVWAEVRRRIADLAGSGGYVVAPVHNIQAEVPPRNIVTMVEAARA